MKTQEEIQQLSEKDFNNRQSVGHYELADLKSRDYYCDGFSNGYNQCQEDMAANMVKLANYLRNNYQPLAPNQAEWQRIKDKKVLRIEDIIEELNKQD